MSKEPYKIAAMYRFVPIDDIPALRKEIQDFNTDFLTSCDGEGMCGTLLLAPAADPMKMVGEYVEPKDWNDLINDPDVILVDTRNDYETKVGIFEGAIDPDLKIFTEFPDWVEKNLEPAKNSANYRRQIISKRTDLVKL